MRKWWRQKLCRHSWRFLQSPGQTERAMSAQVMECQRCEKTAIVR